MEKRKKCDLESKFITSSICETMQVNVVPYAPVYAKIPE